MDAAAHIADTAAMDIDRARNELAAASRDMHMRGWVPATSGNFSLRLDDGDIAITASGRDKARLTASDILRLSLEGQALEDQRPSAETGLHLQLYRRDAGIRAVLHTHSVTATLASMREPGGLRFEGLEILKAFPGIRTHDARLDIPVFANSQDIAALARQVEGHMREFGQGYAYLIAGHGLYTWGASLDACMRQLEALEYLFEYHRLQYVPAAQGSGAR